MPPLLPTVAEHGVSVWLGYMESAYRELLCVDDADVRLPVTAGPDGYASDEGDTSPGDHWLAPGV